MGRPYTLQSILAEAASVYREKTALVFEGRRFSYSQLESLTNKMARALRSRDIRSGDVVALYSQNDWQWLVAYYGSLKAGAVVNPLNFMLTPDEVLYALKDSRAKAILTSPDKVASLDAVASQSARLELKIVYGADGSGDWLPIEKLLTESSSQPLEFDRRPEDLSTICYTSGTTGYPKGAMLSHRAVRLNASLTATMHGRSRYDTVVTGLPCAHVYGNVVMNGAFLTGMTLVLLPRFEEQKVFDAIKANKATMFEGVPAMYLMLMKHPGIGSADLSTLRLCTVGGQTIATEAMRSIEQRFGCPLIELWGMTEIAGLGTTHSYLAENRHGSIGVALPGCQTMIVSTDDPKRPMPPNEPGELMFRGPVVMIGYANNEQATRETIEPDGWLHTGDVAYQDQEGYVFIVDRKKDMIISGGYNIYPAELERVAMMLPEVAMVAIGRIGDEIKGELPKAYVVLKPGAKLDEQTFLAHMRKYLAPYKVPRAVKFVADLPKTSTGKILRRKLQELEDQEPKGGARS